MLRFGAAQPVGRANDALCEGTLQHNGFYGDGIVNALTASLR